MDRIYCARKEGIVEVVLNISKVEESLSWPIHIISDKGDDPKGGSPQHWIISGGVVQLVSDMDKIEEYRESALQKNKKTIEDKIKSGCVTSVRGIVMDCGYNDIQNLQGLQKIKEKKPTATLILRDKNNNFNEVTQKELDDIIFDILEYGQTSYSTKWQNEQTIKTTNDVEWLKTFINS